jgi:hypothetical protein
LRRRVYGGAKEDAMRRILFLSALAAAAGCRAGGAGDGISRVESALQVTSVRVRVAAVASEEHCRIQGDPFPIGRQNTAGKTSMTVATAPPAGCTAPIWGTDPDNFVNQNRERADGAWERIGGGGIQWVSNEATRVAASSVKVEMPFVASSLPGWLKA